jgi:hypothetical protein
VITAEVIQKAMMATTFSGSLTRKEKIGGAKQYAKHPTAMSETMADEKKPPRRDSRTIIIRYRHAVVARLSPSRKQTKVSNARAMLPDTQ